VKEGGKDKSSCRRLRWLNNEELSPSEFDDLTNLLKYKEFDD